MAESKQVQYEETFANDLFDKIVAIRDRRRWMEEQWLRAHRAWMSLNTEMRFVTSDSSPNMYNIPSARRSLERTVIRAAKMITPNVKWFEVSPIEDDTNLINVDNYMWYVLRKKIPSRVNIMQLVRCELLYNLCCMKTSVQVRNNDVWPLSRAVDPFSFYFFPETATSSSEADLIFEDSLMSYDKYKTFVDIGFVTDIELRDIGKPEWPYHLIERLAHQGITDPTQIGSRKQHADEKFSAVASNYLATTTAWLRHNDRLHQAFIVWNCGTKPRLVGFVESRYTEALYRWTIHRSLPNEAFTNSMMDDIVELQFLSNDQINKFQDAVDLAQGIFAIDGTQVHGLIA